MKYILFLALLVSCTNSARYKPQPADTTKTLAVFIGDSVRQIDIVYRITKDTANLATDPIIRGRDTTYYLPYWIPSLDSAGKKILDSATRLPKGYVKYAASARKDVIYDFKVEIDSLLKNR